MVLISLLESILGFLGIFSRRAAPAVIFRRINLVAAMKWNRIELIRYTSFTRTHMGPPVIKSQNHVRRH